ncbi:g4609 [Coccomyxa viridis]|uniref:30S ribosomal protein S15 n=1 Tax=Coccomyxa viridis TaxID=1274662 RepID=A0ABP1FUQ1_9CHLO
MGADTSFSSQRLITTTAPAHRFSRVKDPVSHAGAVAGDDPKVYLVDKFLGSEVMSSSEARQQRINEVVSTYQRYPGDTGSTEVQVAILTVRILAMAEHMKVHRKDFSSRLGLEGMLAQRRKLLQYLRRADFDAYAKMLSALGLKDRYMKQDRLTLRRSSGAEGYQS